MPETSYKILAAKRLNIDPAELLMYLEFRDHALATTPDGHQHIFTFASLTHPAAPVGAGSKPAQPATPIELSNQVKSKTVAKPSKPKK